ncbi:hypothetical protein HMPREF9233_01468 [Actinobaculum massiliense ACS-171-V-Col2]|uniref:Uncharacterized protein n=1 Tax=Actinobaculum massiliense ACS-171-V-Col2 TaxID=883066 RepID=K9EF69_9ACTO|nr:hypothetical protein HMPREF9233_01468 [Actinobaculum massiliense ACS-171-V-Col2]
MMGFSPQAQNRRHGQQKCRARTLVPDFEKVSLKLPSPPLLHAINMKPLTR